MKEFLLKKTPVFFQNILISIFNTWLYKKRQCGEYSKYRQYFAEFDGVPVDQIKAEQARRLSLMINHALDNSEYYNRVGGTRLEEFPILEKEILLTQLNDIRTLPENRAEISLTGGTTGASMKVLYTMEDIQERNAMLDHFRANYGYKLGKRAAWFSGKNLARPQDLAKGICYRDDWINHIRFFLRSILPTATSMPIGKRSPSSHPSTWWDFHQVFTTFA